jgi:hypothetical protein
MAEQPSQPGNGPEPVKPSFLAQAAKALSQLGLTCYVLLLALALLATAGRSPGIAILMGVCAVVPLIFGPGIYRVMGLVALLIAGGFYVTAKPQPQRPGAGTTQESPAAATPAPSAPAPAQPTR